MSKISLQQLAPHLTNTHAKLQLIFLREMLTKASKSTIPYRNCNFAAKLGCSFNEKWRIAPEIIGWWYGRKTIKFSRLIKLIDLSNSDWSEVEKQLIFLKAGMRKGEVFIRFPIELDEKLGTIVGHILGDGSLDKKYRQVFFTNLNSELLQEFITNMKFIFGIEPRIWIQESLGFNKAKWIKRIYDLSKKEKYQVGLFYPSICGIILHGMLGTFANGKNKSITSQIKNAPTSFKKGLLRAIFDDEANVDVPSQMIRFSQDNKILTEELRSMLKEFDIEPNPIRTYFRDGKPHQYFNITHIKNYYLFANIIGFTSSNKINLLKKMIEHVRASHKYKNLILPKL